MSKVPHLFVVIAVLLGLNLNSLLLAQYPLGGASKPKPQLELEERDKQYKRIHQFALRMILDSRISEMETFLKSYLENYPSDEETYYLLSILHARQGQIVQAVEAAQRAVELGLPLGRFVAGPRDLFAPLLSSEPFRQLIGRDSDELVHGPMVGNVTDRSAAFWVRTAEPATVEVTLSQQPDMSGPKRSQYVTTSAVTDFTGVAEVYGLEADAEYYYMVSSRGDVLAGDDHRLTFRTFPSSDQKSRFKIAFGGGAGYVPPHERMWDTIASFDPLGLLLLGDNVYIDDPESIEMNLYTYYRRQSRPEFRRLTSRTAVFSIWDDHDFGTNDSWGGADIDIPFWKREHSYSIYRQNWPNPGFGGGYDQPGCWYTFSIGAVDFIMLDCRYYRTDPEHETPSMLGPVQLKWLERKLKQSRGVFKVICSSVPWDFRTKGDSLDTWNGYKDEREKVFSIIEDNRIEGVFLMSADRHRSDAWRIERSEGYSFYEFNSSRLTNQHVHPTMEDAGAIYSYNAKQSFGLVEFDLKLDDQTVTYSVINIDGEKIYELTVRRSQLVF
jgi:alkaline phosphatase D